MIIIPERELVIITPPRTGSTALLDAVRRKYPLAMSPYRHMEAVGIPQGYEQWEVFCVVRDPVKRMWSLYKYLSSVHAWGLGASEWHRAMQTNGATFEDWLLTGETFFGNPTWLGIPYNPRQIVRFVMPEQRKTQGWYAGDRAKGLRVESEEFSTFCHTRLGLELIRMNDTAPSSVPELTPRMVAHMRKYFLWEGEAYGY